MQSGPPLAGRVALVSGAGVGIGAATARRLAADGAALALVDRDAAAVESLVAALAAAGIDALALAGDATDEPTVARLVAQAVARFGRLDILVNGVGGWSQQRTVQDTTLAEWTAGLTLNVTSAFLCARAAIPHLIASDAGRIVNISSQVARAQQHLTTPDYVAGKAALLALTRYLARELGPHGVTCNAVAPGPTWSPRTRQAWTPALVTAIERETALGRIAEPEDIAAAIAFLASPAARHITGATLDINGGYTLV